MRPISLRFNEMGTLEDLRTTAAVKAILPDAPVTVVTTQWFGSEALELPHKTTVGNVANGLLQRHNEPRANRGAGASAPTATDKTVAKDQR